MPLRPLVPALDGVLFDFDGTLADSTGLFFEISCEVLAVAGAPPVSPERVYALMRSGEPDALWRLFPPDFPSLGATLARIVSERRASWMSRYHDETKPIPGALETLAALRERGLRLGIATSSGRDLRSLDRWGVRELFGAVVGREDVTARKPDPEALLLCARRAGLDGGAWVYVGDSPIDVQAAHAAGAPGIGVLTGTSSRELLAREGPHRILPSVADLEPLL